MPIIVPTSFGIWLLCLNATPKCKEWHIIKAENDDHCAWCPITPTILKNTVTNVIMGYTQLHQRGGAGKMEKRWEGKVGCQEQERKCGSPMSLTSASTEQGRAGHRPWLSWGLRHTHPSCANVHLLSTPGPASLPATFWFLFSSAPSLPSLNLNLPLSFPTLSYWHKCTGTFADSQLSNLILSHSGGDKYSLCPP